MADQITGEHGSEGTQQGRVLLIEDDELIKFGLSVGLKECPASAGLELLVVESVAAALQIKDVKPDVILLDVLLCGGGFEEALHAFERVHAHFPASPIGLLSVNNSARILCGALERGAAGLIPRKTPLPILAIALNLMMAGGVYLPPDFALSLNAASSSEGESTGRRAPGELTGRQQAILDLLAMGASNKEIALRLRLSVGTVKNYVSGLLKLMRMPTRNRLVAHLRQREGGQAEPWSENRAELLRGWRRDGVMRADN